MITEKWDILDENGSPTGKTTLRGRNFLKNGEYHLVVHIWVFSSDGRVLIQRRSDDKPLMPGEWAATGGAAVSGESSYTAANRELFEELGVCSNRKTLKKAFRTKRRNSLLDVWLLESDIPLEKLRLQKTEVSEAKWVTVNELKQMIEEGNFHNYGKEYFCKVFEKIEESRKALA